MRPAPSSGRRASGALSGLPLTAWAALLPVTAVLGATLTAAAGLVAADRLDGPVARALAGGLVVGLLVALRGWVAAARVVATVRAAHSDCGPDVDAPPRSPSRDVALPRELAELSRLCAVLRCRARQADELAERRHREAVTATAGVRQLVHGLVEAEEGARGQLSAELHDTVAQSLMLARSLLASQPATPADLTRVADLVDDAEEQIRALLARARPPALRDGDLADAVSGLCADMGVRYGLDVHLSWPAAPAPLPLATAVTVYRFFQEALLNIVKHADVDSAQIGLDVVDDVVLATVRDDGPGFEPEHVRAQGGRHVGLGLLGERARLSGGSLRVDSGGGLRGTVVRMWLPRPSPGALPEPPDVRVPAQRAPSGSSARSAHRGG